MREELLPTAVALRDLNCRDLSTLNDRILMQKKIYILQELGFDLGYNFSWNLHGPYSTELTAAAYECVATCSEEELKSFEFSENVIPYIDKTNSLEKFRQENLTDLSMVEWYELVASLLFWKRREKTIKAAMKNLNTTKPQFGKSQANLANKALDLIGL